MLSFLSILILQLEVKIKKPSMPNISPNEMNKYLRTIVVAPMTTNAKKYPTRVAIKSNGKKGMIAIDFSGEIQKLSGD